MSFTIYALRHKPSGRFYIGSTGQTLEKRLAEWEGAFRNTLLFCGKGGWRSGAQMSRKLFETSTRWEDYAPVVLEVLPDDATPDDAAKAENRAIAWANALVPDLLLNSFSGTHRPGADGYRTYRMRTGRIGAGGPPAAISSVVGPLGTGQAGKTLQTRPQGRQSLS